MLESNDEGSISESARTGEGEAEMASHGERGAEPTTEGASSFPSFMYDIDVIWGVFVGVGYIRVIISEFEGAVGGWGVCDSLL